MIPDFYRVNLQSAKLIKLKSKLGTVTTLSA